MRFREPGSPEPAEGLSTARATGPYYSGKPEECARRKAKLFPSEGGPAILEFELPDEIVSDIIAADGMVVPGKAWDSGSEIRFVREAGLPELLERWPDLTKRVILLREE